MFKTRLQLISHHVSSRRKQYKIKELTTSKLKRVVSSLSKNSKYLKYTVAKPHANQLTLLLRQPIYIGTFLHWDGAPSYFGIQAHFLSPTSGFRAWRSWSWRRPKSKTLGRSITVLPYSLLCPNARTPTIPSWQVYTLTTQRSARKPKTGRMGGPSFGALACPSSTRWTRKMGVFIHGWWEETLAKNLLRETQTARFFYRPR